MKRIPSFLIALALGVTTSAQAGLITDPLSFDQPIIDQGLTTDPLGNDGPKTRIPAPSSAPVNVAAASTFLVQVVGALPADGTLRMSDLFMNPEFFAAAHAPGPQADALRGQIDWLMLTGVILGLDGDDGLDDFDGMDGSDDLTGDAGDDFSSDSAEHNPNIVAGPAPFGFSFGTTQALGFSFGTTQSHNRPAAPANGIILGGPGTDTIILGGPGTDTVQPHANLKPFNPSIILGGPGSDNIILGGPGSDNLSSAPTGHNPN